MANKIKYNAGFTLIELLVVIAVMALLLAVAVPNYLGARERARDAKKKQELVEMKKALRMYYNDFQSYPSTLTACSPTVDFASGTGCETVYMKKFPADFGGAIEYFLSSSDDFCLTATLENASDTDIADSQSRCVSACGTNCDGAMDYCACSD